MSSSSSSSSPPLPRLLELRPGRLINVFHWTLNESQLPQSQSPQQRTINLICVHGTAANHQQFIPLFTCLQKECLLRNNQTEPLDSIDCWSYDAMGCGESPALPHRTDYSDEEQVKDLCALLMDHVVDLTRPTYLVGHSYGPNWIYKLLLQLRRQPPFRDDTTPNYNMLHTMNLQGLILISSGVANPKYSLQTGGPGLFRVVPLWLLQCLQPLLTHSFLHMGFSPHTHRNNPTLIATAKRSNNRNDMTIVCRYYQSHDWITAEEIGTHLRHNDDDNDNRSPAPPRPPLVLHGEDDQILPVQCGQELCNAWSGGGGGGGDVHVVPLTIIPQASHMVLLEQPQPVAHLIYQYMSRGP